MTTAQITHAQIARALYEAHSSVECLSIEDLRELQLSTLGSQANSETSWLPHFQTAFSSPPRRKRKKPSPS